MRIVKVVQNLNLDVMCDDADIVEIRTQNRITGQVIYVDINGITILRIGYIKNEVTEIIKE